MQRFIFSNLVVLEVPKFYCLTLLSFYTIFVSSVMGKVDNWLHRARVDCKDGSCRAKFCQGLPTFTSVCLVVLSPDEK